MYDVMTLDMLDGTDIDVLLYPAPREGSVQPRAQSPLRQKGEDDTLS